jgi:hypothetical protein
VLKAVRKERTDGQCGSTIKTSYQGGITTAGGWDN